MGCQRRDMDLFSRSTFHSCCTAALPCNTGRSALNVEALSARNDEKPSSFFSAVAASNARSAASNASRFAAGGALLPIAAIPAINKTPHASHLRSMGFLRFGYTPFDLNTRLADWRRRTLAQ